MNEQIFECDVLRPGSSQLKAVFFVILYAVFGLGILGYLFYELGLETLVSIYKIVLAAGTALFILIMAYAKASELWETRNIPDPESASLVFTDEALENRMGLTKFVVPYDAIREIVEPSKEGDSVCLVLTDGVPISLPIPRQERDFLMHLKAKLPNAL